MQVHLSEMHDAFEVLLVLLTCLHRAEAGSSAAQGQDPQLPRRVRVPRAALTHTSTKATSSSSTTPGSGFPALANGHGHAHTVAAPAAGGGYAAAVAASMPQQQHQGRGAGHAEQAGSSPSIPSTVAHSLFGLEVQMAPPAGASADEDKHSRAGRGRRDSTGGSAAPTAQPAALAVPAASNGHVGYAAAAAAGAAAAAAAAGDVVDVYTRYFHLVHAQSLKKAFAAVGGSESGAYFEDVLCAAEAIGAHGASAGSISLPRGRSQSGAAPSASPGAANGPSSATGSGGGGAVAGGGWVPGSTAASHPLATVFRFPAVFTLALVWESPQAPQDLVRGVLEALGSRVDLGLLFKLGATGAGSGAPPPSAQCELRSVICYFGHHYVVSRDVCARDVAAYIRTVQMRRWLHVEPCAAMCRRGLSLGSGLPATVAVCSCTACARVSLSTPTPHDPRTLQCLLQVFARSEEVGLWLLIDDANVQLVGTWGDVLRAMCAKRLQPSLLFYEAERKTPVS